MIRKILAITAVVALGIGLAATPAQASHLPASYCNGGSPNWHGWTWPSSGASWGAGNWCGEPWNGEWKGATWDNAADGKPVSLFGAPFEGGTLTPVSGSTASGYGMVTQTTWKSGTIMRLVVVVHTQGGTPLAVQDIYRCSIDAPSGTTCV